MPMPVGQVGNSVPMPVGQIGNSVPMSRRLNRESPCEARGLLYWTYFLFLTNLQMLLIWGWVMDLSDHTDCCGSECKQFHLVVCTLIHIAVFLFIAVAYFVMHGPSYSS